MPQIIHRARRAIAAVSRITRRMWIVIAVAIAVALVSTVTVDLGPVLKARAERAGGNWLQRPLQIGRLGILIARGRFVLEDLRIGGLTPDAEPWLVAKRVEVSLTWGAILHREVLLDSIEMSDWRMVSESFASGVQTFPRLTGPPRPPSTGPRPVVTTLQFVRAFRGEFVYRDHGAPWGIVARHLDVTMSKLGQYRGTASFPDGTVDIQQFVPMSASMTSTFRVEGTDIVFDAMELVTDGAVSKVTGRLDATHWPEQTYQIDSRIQFSRMRELFFARDTFSLHGEGDFRGKFHLFKGGRELTGDFYSAEAGLNDFRFPQLEGSLVWVPDRFEVTRASAGFAGGYASFRYLMAPLGKAPLRPRSRFDVDYTDVDLDVLTSVLQPEGMRLAGRATGRNRLEWPMGDFAGRDGDGEMTMTAPDGVTTMGRQLPPAAAAAARARATVLGPFSDHIPLAPIGMSGRIVYAFDREAIRLQPSVVATAETYVTFEGATGWGDRSNMPFRVTSANWQESDRLLAGLMSTFGAATKAIPIDGVGRFDGVMLGSFRRPRIEGRFVGDEMRAWSVTWGRIDGDFVVENSYAVVSRAVVEVPSSRMDVSGQFSLGYPRRDGGEEIDARVRIEGRPMKDLLEAFDLEDYDVDGVVSGDFHVYGQYTRPFGFGRLSIKDGIAYGEPFATAEAALRFEGAGVRLDGLQVQKSGGLATGAAYVGWNGAYSFNADGRRMAVDQLAMTAVPGYPPLTGLLDFTATGSGTFDEPRYDVKVGVRDLFFGDEGVGEITSRLSVRDTVLTFELDAASPRLSVSGTGRIALTDEMDAELSFRMSDTSLDPYLRAVQPDFSPFTSAVVSGSLRVVGELYNPDALSADATVDKVDLRFLDYTLTSAAPLKLGVDGQILQIDTLRLVGDGTELSLTGSVDLPARVLALSASGGANLAVLQGFLPDVRSSGRADVSALVTGSIDKPTVSGNALLSDGRLRHFGFPHALEALNGIVTFNAGGVRFDGLSGRLAGGPVRFTGSVGLAGYRLSEYDIAVAGEDLRLRYPEGMRSVVDVDLALQGPAAAPVVTGTVTVKDAAWSRPFNASGGLFSFSGGGSDVPVVVGAINTEAASALRFDVRLVAPSTVRIDTPEARIVASADLNLRGTFERPLVFGRADLERGEVRFEGRRYLVTRGSLDFTTADRIQPFFDIEAETRVRVPGQTYRVTLRMAGTTERLQPEFTSDPPLPPLEILTLLFSDTSPSGDVELAALQRPNEREQRLLEARATRALTGTLSAEVGRVVQETFGVDTFQITPLLVDPYQQSARLNVNPSARVTIGKRISDRIYLTYARSLSSSRIDEIILLEFDQSDSLAWVLSQNEDRTYALEVRKRHAF